MYVTRTIIVAAYAQYFILSFGRIKRLVPTSSYTRYPFSLSVPPSHRISSRLHLSLFHCVPVDYMRTRHNTISIVRERLYVRARANLSTRYRHCRPTSRKFVTRFPGTTNTSSCLILLRNAQRCFIVFACAL